MNNYINNTGYLDNTETSNNPLNIIPSNIITMKGVSRPLTLVPIVNGKPLYSKKIIAKPGDPDINFGNDVEGVLELPYAQIGMMTNPMLMNTLNGIMNAPNQLNTALDYGLYSIPPIDSSLEGYNYTPKQQNIPNPPLPKYVVPPAPPSIEEYRKQQAQKYNNYDGSVPPSEESINRYNSQMDTFFNGKGKVETDPNELQKMNASLTKYEEDKKKKQGKPFVGAINPYGGWNLANSSVMLGASIQDGNTLGIIGSAGKILTEGARNAFSGAAAMKRFRENQDDFAEALQEEMQKQGEYWAPGYQKGGNINYVDILKNKKIIKTEFDSKTNEYVITYN